MGTITASRSPAEIYDEKFVPALFEDWGPVVAKAAGIAPGQSVLDIACGTGALTLAVVGIVGPRGRVVGLDLNPDMLAVARRKSTAIDWREGAAERLPFDDASFDAVVSQFGMMFFEDRPGAVAEMRRVARPGGALAVAVCGAVERSPGYAAFADILDRLFGRAVGDAFRAPFVLGDAAALRRVFEAAGVAGVEVAEHVGAVRFASIEELVSTERACVWTLGGILDDAQFERLLREAETVLARFREAGGAVRFDMPALIATARKPV